MPRDINGTYTLPAGNPVISNTIIESVWCNTTMDDIAAALTDSVSRTGLGGFLGVIAFGDGTKPAPGIAWTNQPTVGFYRAGTNDMRLAIANTDIQQWTLAATYIGNPLTVSGGLTVSGNETITGTSLIQGAVTIDDTLTVTGDANFLGSLALAGSLSATQLNLTTGSLYLPNTQGVYWRNAANTNYYVGAYVTGADQMVIGSTWATLHLYAASIPRIVMSVSDVLILDGTGAVTELSIGTGVVRFANNAYFNNQRGLYFKTFGGLDQPVLAVNTSDEVVYGVGPTWVTHYFFCLGTITFAINAAGVTVSTNLFTTGNINCAGALNVTGAMAGSTTLTIGSTFTILATSAGNYIAFLNNAGAATPYGFSIGFTAFGSGSRGYGNYYMEGHDTGGTPFAMASNGGLLNHATLNVDISDSREKQDIDAGYDYTPFVEKLAYKRFKYKKMLQMGEHTGLIAQDVEAYAPELIVDKALNNMKGVQYVQLQARINSVIPRLIARIKALEAKLP